MLKASEALSWDSSAGSDGLMFSQLEGVSANLQPECAPILTGPAIALCNQCSTANPNHFILAFFGVSDPKQLKKVEIRRWEGKGAPVAVPENNKNGTSYQLLTEPVITKIGV